MLGSAQRQPNSGSTTTNAGRQSQMRLSCVATPGSPSPLSGFLAGADLDIRADQERT